MIKESEDKDEDETERQVERKKERKKHRNHEDILQISRGHKTPFSFTTFVGEARCHEPCRNRADVCHVI